MKPRLFSYLGWVAVVVTVALWGTFGWFISDLSEERANYSSAQTALAQMQDEQDAAAKLHAAARDTKSEREALDALAKTDVLSAVDTIEKVGVRVGIKLHVEGATAGPLSNNKPSKDVHAFLITATSEGKLQPLMRAISLLETLPLATSLFGLELQQVQADPQGKVVTDFWRLTVRIRIITTSPIGA